MSQAPKVGLSVCPPGMQNDDYYDFSLDEIREQLEVLGYRNVPRHKLVDFKRDLDNMLQDKMSECSSVISEDTIGNQNESSDDFMYAKRCPAVFGNKRNEGVFKRKIVRRDRDGRKYHDESFSEVSDLPGASDEDATPRNHDSGDHIQYCAPIDKYADYDDDSLIRSRHARFMEDPVAGVLDYTKEMKPMSARSMGSNQSSSGSLVRPQKTRPVPRKHDPVARYHQYSDFWKIQKAPGEKTHRQLRWAVKEAMMIHDIPPKRPQSHIPINDYVPPTENHRDDLRWNIRQELALHGIPSEFSFPSSSSQHRPYYDF